MYETIGISVAALLSIAMFTLLYKENVFFRIAEHMLLGCSIGYAFVLGAKFILQHLDTVITGNYIELIPIALGILLYTKFSDKYKFIHYYPLALLVGISTAVATRGMIEPEILAQLRATFLPIFGIDAFTAFNNIVIIVSVFFTLAYFFFTFGGNGRAKQIRTIGRCFMMIGFGALFGSFVMTRLSQLIGALQLILFDWLRLG